MFLTSSAGVLLLDLKMKFMLLTKEVAVLGSEGLSGDGDPPAPPLNPEPAARVRSCLGELAFGLADAEELAEEEEELAVLMCRHTADV